MTWRSTAAASGLMLVGTWLASYAPVGGPRPEPALAPTPARTAAAAAEIQREADRLHDRLKRAADYQLPARNPFEFGRSRAAAPPPSPPPVAVEAPLPEAPPPPPPLRLAGIAADGEGEALVRTAIISGPANVYLLKVGETLNGAYTVTAIGADSVDLVRLDDGTALRLTLQP